ncbi:MarR family winged helix-turn-helix transcriptional regulator [Nocardia sp. alder85J]|uniref:MarR family winged helix-turn-helix transcriptional regulator n=1 Tax=Nocardia sp. alder85J TaxID=2862949 RepID=UPI001CD5A020|nr:winged helix DNA-binding protein [Nocardia sp. alder85J]MCX4095006.1 winged helix DNA-binding protein [Nocardia sp. alder85J]
MEEDDVHRLQQQLKLLYRRIQRENPVMEGISIPMVQVLVTVRRSPTALGPSDVADELQMKSSNVAAALRALEDLGLILRRPDTADRRRVFIELTDRGLQVLAEIRRSRQSWLQDTMSTALTPAEQRIMLVAGELMERLAQQE